MQSVGFGIPATPIEGIEGIESIGNDITESVTDVIMGNTAGRCVGDVNVSGTSSSVITPGVAPRVYPPSKPHHGSGRQIEPLLRLRDELRKGVDR